MWSIKKQVGFTLIEILVVTTIISILSAILYANFTSARQDARNKIMRTTLSEIQLALEVYRAQNGFYPLPATTPAACYGSAPGLYTGINSGSCPTHRLYITGLVPDFIASIPTAAELSRNSTCQIQYRVNDNISPTAYKLTLVRCVEGVTGAANGVKQVTNLPAVRHRVRRPECVIRPPTFSMNHLQPIVMAVSVTSVCI